MKERHANIAVFVPHNGCPNQCSFCNQRTISGAAQQPTPADVAAALQEHAARLEGGAVWDRGELAFFGGSFTAIERDYMCSLLEAAQPFLRAGVIDGIRCSTRPDCIDSEVLACLKGYGVTAIELGAQSMDDRVLALNRRGHTAQQVREASGLIKAEGFELGLQMMTGLYGDSNEGAINTATEIAALQPDTVRIYPTVVLRETELAQLYQAGVYTPQTTDEAAELCATLLPIFAERGIRVIRVGLHAEENVERNYVAGAYHPALRELCESRIFLRRMTGLAGQYTAVDYRVNPRDVSKALGQRRCNIDMLKKQGIEGRIIQDAAVPQGEIIAEERIEARQKQSN
ncbi:MAG: radical SAM protein [Ruminococcaceae bacterium]|nr:radical SAM protein [Oscillospiraceae bacterium]